MKLNRVVLFAGAMLLFVMSIPSASAPKVEPSEAALKLVESLPARAMGVERAGNLWVWNDRSKTVELISSAGARLERLSLPDLWLVDADAEWGVAGLFQGGHEIRWVRWDGTTGGQIRLPQSSSAICWTGPDTVAIAPKIAPYRVEIWNVRTQKFERSLGKETIVLPKVGATRMRAMGFRYDFDRDLLYTLDSFTGELQVFSKDGSLSWKQEVENPRRAETEAWLQKVDQEAKAQGDIQQPTVFSLWLSLHAGEPWVIQNRDQAAQTVTLAKLSPKDVATQKVADVRCASFHFTLWGGWIISYNPSPGGEVCNTVRRMP